MSAARRIKPGSARSSAPAYFKARKSSCHVLGPQIYTNRGASYALRASSTLENPRSGPSWRACALPRVPETLAQAQHQVRIVAQGVGGKLQRLATQADGLADEVSVRPRMARAQKAPLEGLKLAAPKRSATGFCLKAVSTSSASPWRDIDALLHGTPSELHSGGVARGHPAARDIA